MAVKAKLTSDFREQWRVKWIVFRIQTALIVEVNCVQNGDGRDGCIGLCRNR